VTTRSEFTPLRNASAAAGLRNLDLPALYEEVLRRGEGRLAPGGSLVVDTGQHTGRSPKDKVVVREPATEKDVWWDNNNPFSRDRFDVLLADMVRHASRRPLLTQDLHAGAEPAHRIGVLVITELAWHSLFIRNFLIRPDPATADDAEPDMTILCLPSFKADPQRHGVRGDTVIACDLANRVVLIGGTYYAGEMKKSVFTMLNFWLPKRKVLPMHCSAKVVEDGNSALFFGLSGTGKTTRSASRHRTSVGDDEHGWSDEGIFNFEGGCYAKACGLDAEAEPEIFATTGRFGTVLENVAMAPVTRRLDFDDVGKTENTRVAYPLDFIANASTSGRAGHPKTIVMLTADAFGVMPAIARLSTAQAIYYYLLGFTAKVAGTERGVTEPQPTPRHAFARRSCHAIRPSLLRCFGKPSKSTARRVGCSIPVGLAVPTGLVAACLFPGRAFFSRPHSTGRWIEDRF